MQAWDKLDAKGKEKMRLRELKNGRLAMIAVGGMVHHYLLVGRGPIEFLKNIPNFKNPLPNGLFELN